MYKRQTWRQFNNNEKNSKKRKEVFDEFIEKTKYISPIIYSRFEKVRSIYLTIQQIAEVIFLLVPIT